MRTPPDDLTEAELAALLADAWGLHAGGLEHAPVGFGSHHWVATNPTGARWFVTVDDVDECGFARLRRALLALRQELGEHVPE